MTARRSADLILTSLLACLCLHVTLGEKLHVLISEIARDSRHIQLTDGREVVQFVKNAANEMLQCGFTDERDQIERILQDEKRMTWSDPQAVTMDFWRKTCQENRARSSQLTKRKTFPEIIYPGTKWCGPGDDAEDYDDLGEYKETDKCCRRHDKCPIHLLPFETKYHYFNFRPWTVTSCSCDEDLFDCLKAVTGHEKTESNRIGDVFFGKVNPPCFRLERDWFCSKRHWSYLWCVDWDIADDVAVFYTYLDGEWSKVNKTREIQGRPKYRIRGSEIYQNHPRA